MKIRTLRVENLRGLSHIECTFDQPTNVIVGPNAIGKTTILEAIRIMKALLMPRYYQEGHQVLTSLGAISPHPQLASYLDYSALARNPDDPIIVFATIDLSDTEVDYIRKAMDQIALELMRSQMAKNDEQSQLAFTQFLSTNDGQSRLKAMTDEVKKKIDAITVPFSLPIRLTMDGSKRRMGGDDIFNQTVVAILERQYPPSLALMSYFPADRAFPTGEVNVQIGSGEANNQIQSHIGNAASKYQRLKQTIVNNLLLSELDHEKLADDFQLVLENLLPGKRLAGLSVTPVGTLKVAIEEMATGKIFDIDSMSSGEKGLILTFLLLRRSLAPGGIALVDEPELHLNPAVCKNIIPFLNEHIAQSGDIQIILCTHSAEILGAAFDHKECTIHHLRSHKDATKIYERDSREVFDALRRLGTTAAESLFARGNIFVEGDHDAAILEEGFYELIAGYRITSLGGRAEIEKEIKTLQRSDQNGELDKLNCFIFDSDHAPSSVTNTAFVHVLQWDRYCLENYLINRKLLFDELQAIGVNSIGSRGTFESRIIEMAISQLVEVVVRSVYKEMEPESPGLRATEVSHKNFSEIGEILVSRLKRIEQGLAEFDPVSWKDQFVAACEEEHAKAKELWKEDWLRLCSGKRLIDDVYREYQVPISKYELKKRLVQRMKLEQSEDWTLVRSKLRDALGNQ